MPLDVDRLRVFREVANRGSFTAAARALSFTQPAISHHINRLEEELGVTLMERSARGLTLTAPGETLLQHADALLARVEEAERHVVEVASADAGLVRLVAFPTAAATIVPRAVASFRKSLPRTSLTLAEADPPDSLPELKRGDWDFALAYDYPSVGEPLDPGLDYESLFLDRMALCVRRDDPRAAAKTLDLREFAADPWVTPYDCVCRTALELACRQAGFAPRIASESNDYMAMQGLVAAGVGVALVPRLIRAMAVRPEVALRPVRGTDIVRVVALVARSGGYRSPAASALRLALHDAVADVDHAALPLDRDQPELVKTRAPRRNCRGKAAA
jgi:DNA-binding transcriptional LysR family regulator